jgi:biotin carboxylase
MPRALLILPTAGYRTEDFLAAASALDVEVVVATDRRQTIGDAIRIDLRRPERAADAIVELARERPLDAVVAADDGGVVAAAIAATRLGLPSNPPEAASRARDKLALRRALAAAGVSQPRFAELPPGGDVAAVGFPAVLKPAGLAMGRGVIRADDAEGARESERRIRKIVAAAGDDPAAPLLLEEYVPGVEVAVEALLRGGRMETLAVFDKPDPLEGPYFEETIYVTPSRLPEDAHAAVERLVATAASAVGLREGPVHAEVRLDGPRLWAIELAARSIGGLCGRTLRFGLGVRLEELILRHALGLPLEGRLRREQAAAGVMMLPIPAAGTLRGVSGQDEARAVPGISDLTITIPVGGRTVPLPEGDRYLGFMFARGATPDEVETALRTVHARLDVAIDPV